MVKPFSIFPLPKAQRFPTPPPTPCLSTRHIPTSPPPSPFPLLGLLLSLYLTKDHSSNWCPSRPSSAAFLAGTMYTPWLMVQSLRVLGCLKSFFFPWGCKPLQLLQTTLQILHWRPQAQSNSWLLVSASVFVGLWQVPSGGSHGMLLLVHASCHSVGVWWLFIGWIPR